ncbi:ATP-binding cassette domain-containing protein [Rhodovarius crocodyli]|uniref:ATP-binding cassette domain-containing protein n=1 Tax=Rhodovarius crocodyli TaxID=1979269 RepID=A0A437ME72_9PROT|nr:ABC transporter transmembrane domain-containing protein [Rhodovarius crocodyli]RVT95970.1 ATP-binding cassette domain-containing protein [Rhodovarius crocodyli]
MTRAPLAALGLLLPWLRPYLPRALGALALLLVSSAMLLGLGQGLKRFIDEGFSGGTAALDATGLGMFGLCVGFGLASAGRYWLITWLGERVAADLRTNVFRHVLTLSPGWYATHRTGDILSRLTADIALLQSLVGSAVSMALRNTLMGIGAAAMLVLTSVKLAAIALGVVPLVVAPLLIFGRRERRLSRTAQERVADVAATAEESINAIETVQAFTSEARIGARFAANVEESVGAASRRISARAALILAVILLGFGAVTFALWVGGHDVLSGRMSAGELSAFVFYAVLMASSTAAVSEVWGEIQRAAGAADRLGELLEARAEIAPPASPRPLPPARGEVAFEHVSFAYAGRGAALDDVSFQVAPGETVALVGPSGAGKTTILKLLLRFHDPAGGRILLDGMDLRDAAPEALRARIALVGQEPVIFSGTVAENIRFGRPEASDAEVQAAAEAAAAHGYISALPQGYATELGARGVSLSGGQRQRLAIARAILRDAPVLLLDEATSALDAESERAVQQALERLSEGRTTLVVAHRLATVRRADRILVLDQGRVVASGTHAALMAEGGLYARLAALQFIAE